MAKLIFPQSLRICFVAQKFPFLGQATDYGFLWPVARALVRKGHHVTVISWRSPEGKSKHEQDGVKAYFVGETTLLSKDYFATLAERKFNELHRAQPFHIVHSADASGMLIGKKRRKYQIAMVYDVQATQMSQIFSILGMAQETLGGLLRTAVAVCYKFLTTYFRVDRRLTRTADAMFVQSPQQRVVLERYYLYPDRRIFTVPFGIDVSDLSPREKSEELRKRLDIPSNAPIVVTVTDMTEFGEMRNLLRAFERVAIKKPSARLIVVGQGPLRKQIEFEMLNLVLGGRVIFAGAIGDDQLPNYIALADIFVNLSTRTSGFEPSLIEAMAQKKVVVGSEVSPMATLIEDGVDGFLIRPADTFTLSELLIRAFHGQLPSTEMGERARTKVLNFFDMEKMVSLTLQAYKEAMLRTGKFRRPQNEPLQVSMAAN